MQFIHALSLRTKLISLFILIAMGMTLTSVVGYFNVSSMKKKLDDLYFGSFIPVNELNKLIRTYEDGVQTTVYKLKEGSISPFEASEKLSYSIDNINHTWSTYTSHYKTEEELPYIQYTTQAIKNANIHVQRVIDACHINRSIHGISTSYLSGVIEKMTSIVIRLKEYEMEVARSKRHALINTYENTLFQIGMIFLVALALILYLSQAMFRSIHSNQYILEQTTEKLKKANIELERSSYTDSLTGIHNRRYFNVILTREFKRAKRNGHHFTFMMIDVDYFKSYNDEYGHLEGDTTLKSVAGVMNETLQRPGDYIFRLGGEEFGVIISETDPKNAQMLAEKIRRNVEELRIEHKESDVTNVVTVSIGLTTIIPAVNLSEEVILSEADINLYKAKENGRNQVAVSTSILQRNHPELERDVS